MADLPDYTVGSGTSEVHLSHARIGEPVTGTWTANVDCVEPIALNGGPVSIRLHTQLFIGRIRSEGVEGGRWRARIVGGLGDLTTTLDAKNYANATLGAVLADFDRETGSVPSLLNESLAGHRVANWQRSQGAAADTLNQVALELGYIWRIFRDGTYYLGPLIYIPAPELDGHVVKETGIFPQMVWAPDGDPAYQPGLTVDEREITYVETMITPNSMRQRLFFSS